MDITKLREFFRISNAIFELQNKIQLNCNDGIVNVHVNDMQELHKLALEEIEKENPDLSKVEKLLSEMENLSERNSQPNFKKGGF